jgi:RND family efflux transporter MFP subunit
MPHFRSFVPALVLPVALASLVTACGRSQPAPAAGGAPAMPVETLELMPSPVDDAAEFVGLVRSRRSTTIQPQADGIITAIRVSSGARVAPGAVLFELDAAAQRAAVASIESQRASREADVELARQQAERAKRLLEVGASSQQEFEQAQTQQKTAEAQLKSVEEQIRQQQAQLDYYRVVAPTGGVVGDIPVRVGDRVTTSTPLTTVDGAGGLEIYISVPVQQAPRLRIGLPVRVIDDKGETLAAEHVTFVAPSVDDTTQTVLVKASLTGEGRQFRPDQYVRTEIVFNTEPGLLLPLVAATRVNGQYFVFVAEPDGKGGTVAHQRPVVVGAMKGNAYVVQSGLKAGDRVVVSGIQKIGDGAPVQATPAPAATGQAPPGQRPAAGAPAAAEGR